jgi:DNA-directed RNA polymerase subunit E"
MAKPKACRLCSTIVEEGDKCTNCGSKELTEGFKGRAVILNPEKSEVAQKLKLKDKGNFAIKTR